MKLRIHPLFFLAGILSAFTGDFLLFLLATAAALEHECAHAFAARRVGFTLNKIVLMPYGAVISGDIAGIPPASEIAVAAAGPLANAVTALFFVALWWLFPETYPYTDVAMYTSLSLFLCNLLPAYPLDGGRILKVALSPLGEGRARHIVRVLSIITSLAIFAFFLFTLFSVPRWNALFFALCILFGCFGGGSYQRIRFSRKRSFQRGIEELRIAVSADCTLYEVLRYLKESRYLVLVLYDGEEYLGEMTEPEYLNALNEGKGNCKLKDCFAF